MPNLTLIHIYKNEIRKIILVCAIYGKHDATYVSDIMADVGLMVIDRFQRGVLSHKDMVSLRQGGILFLKFIFLTVPRRFFLINIFVMCFGVDFVLPSHFMYTWVIQVVMRTHLYFRKRWRYNYLIRHVYTCVYVCLFRCNIMTFGWRV